MTVAGGPRLKLAAVDRRNGENADVVARPPLLLPHPPVETTIGKVDGSVRRQASGKPCAKEAAWQGGTGGARRVRVGCGQVEGGRSRAATDQGFNQPAFIQVCCPHHPSRDHPLRTHAHPPTLPIEPAPVVAAMSQTAAYAQPMRALTAQ